VGALLVEAPPQPVTDGRRRRTGQTVELLGERRLCLPQL
jgi:hypothetical protein